MATWERHGLFTSEVYMQKVQAAMLDGYQRALDTANENKRIALKKQDAGGDPNALAEASAASIVESRPLHQ